MNRILLTILALIYFALSVRATVHLHDCMDIFAGSTDDIHTEEKEKEPCKNDPSQCKLESQRKVVEAPSKWLRVVDEALIPVSAFSDLECHASLHKSTPTKLLSGATNTTSLNVLHCLWRI